MSAEESDHMEEEMDYFDPEDVQFEEVEVDGMGEIPDDEEGDGEDEVALIIDDDMETEAKEDVEDMATYVFSKHSKAVSCVAVSPNNPRLFVTGGEDDCAYIWTVPEDPNQDISFTQLNGHTDTVTSVGFNFNGNLVLTGSYDGTVRIWDLTGKEIITLDGPEDIEWATWHSKGNAVLAGSKDGTVWLWLTHTGQCIQVFAGHDGLVSSGCFAQDGKTVCTAGEDGTIRLWHPKTGACKHVFDSNLGGHEATVTCLATQGDYLLSGSEDGTAKLFHLAGNKYLMTYNHASKRAHATIQPTSEISTNAAANTGADGEEDGEEGEAVNGVECVAFAPEAYKFVSTGGLDHQVHIWEMSTGHLRVSLAHDGGVVSMSWHPTMPFLVTGCLDGAVRLWDGRNGDCLQMFTGHAEMVTNVALHVMPFPLLLPTPPTETPAQSTEGANAVIQPPVPPATTHALSQNTLTIVSTSDDSTARVFVLDLNALQG